MRVWDKFLTERDKQLMTQTAIRSVTGFGKKPALLLIDNYIAGLGDEPLPVLESIKKYPFSIGLEGWEAVKHQQRLLKLCRELDIMVIHTNLDVAASSPRDFLSAVRGDIKKRTMAADQAMLNPAAGPRPFELVADLAPLDEEPVIMKSSPSAFHGTTLLNVLTRHSIDTLLVCGESTSGCVRASVVDAASYNFHAIVVEECVYDRTEASHAINLFDMEQKYADVLSIDHVCSYLQEQFGLAKAS